MKTVFRCDDRPQSGLGHLRRCEALAGALRVLGHETVFLPHGTGPTPSADLIVVDSYDATEADFERWRSIAPLCVIDDLGGRDVRTAAVVVNQNFGAERIDYGGASATLLGPAFAMLREQFRAARESATRTFSPTDRRLLVTLGGGPVGAALHEVLAALDAVDLNLDVTVLGTVTPSFRSPHSVRFVGYLDDMALEMGRADVCITAGGVSTLELCCLGTPMMVLTLAPNQVPGARVLCERGAAVPLGAFPNAVHDLASEVRRLFGSVEMRRKLSARGMAEVDGQGAERVAAHLSAMPAVRDSHS